MWCCVDNIGNLSYHNTQSRANIDRFERLNNGEENVVIFPCYNSLLFSDIPNVPNPSR